MANTTVYPYGTEGSLPSSIGIVNDFITGGADKALAAEAGKELYGNLFGEEEIIATKEDASTHKVKSGIEVVSNFNRYKFLLPITEGQYIRASIDMGQGVAVSIYDTEAKAVKGDTDYLQTLSYTYTSSVKGQALFSGFLAVSLAKTGNEDFSSDDVITYTNALELVVSTQAGDGLLRDIDNRVTDIERKTGNLVPLALGTLVQKSLTSSDLSDTNAEHRVSMLSKIAIPYSGATLYFQLPDYICVGIRSGNEAQNLNNNDFFYFNGASFTFATSAHYFRLCFAKATHPGSYDTNEQEIPVATIQDYIARGEIKIFISSEVQPDIIQRNYDTEKYVKGAMRNFVIGNASNGSLTKLPVFAHTSDLHGDMRRAQSYLRYCDYLGVDAALVSGDIVANLPADSTKYLEDLSDASITPLLPCLGNHDVYNVTSAQNQAGQIQSMIDKVSGVYSETYGTYYYKDFAAKKIRVIALNIYETDHSGHNCNFTQTQCDWFIAALASTPADYGVLIMFHSPENTITAPTGKEAFYQKINNFWQTQPGITGTPILKIVDAFIGKTTLSLSYTSNGSGISTTADFSSLNSGVEFIAYINGHEHIDLVGYLDGTTYRQLNLNVCCGIAVYGTTNYYLANNSDLPRGEKGATQDAFNIYAIDRTAKTVRIARVGSNISGYDFQERKYMEIPYAE